MVAVNLFQTHISIYTSRLERPVENIRPDMVLGKAKIPVIRVKFEYLAFPGVEQNSIH